MTVIRDGQSVGGTSIMGLMMLAAGPGSKIAITAEGPQGRKHSRKRWLRWSKTGFDEDCVGDG